MKNKVVIAMPPEIKELYEMYPDRMVKTEFVLVAKYPKHDNPLFPDVWTDYCNKFNVLSNKMGKLGLNVLELNELINARDEVNKASNFELCHLNMKVVI